MRMKQYRVYTRVTATEVPILDWYLYEKGDDDLITMGGCSLAGIKLEEAVSRMVERTKGLDGCVEFIIGDPPLKLGSTRRGKEAWAMLEEQGFPPLIKLSTAQKDMLRELITKYGG
jgi:hypothetical protein